MIHSKYRGFLTNKFSHKPLKLFVLLFSFFIFYSFVITHLSTALAATPQNLPPVYEFQIGGVSGDGLFNRPYGISVSNGYVYVADTSNNRIQKFDLNGNFVTKWGSVGSGNGQLNKPQGIFVSEGYVYVTEENNSRIQKFDLNGNFVAKWGSYGNGDGQFSGPYGIFVSNDYVYVADSDNNRIQKFDLNGNFVSKWGSKGSGDGQFNYLNGISASDGYVYVADFGNHRIQKFDTNGNFVSKWGSNGSGDGQFKSPNGISASDGYVYVADSSNNRIQKFDLNGNFISKWESGQLNSILASGGYVYVVASSNFPDLGRVQKYDTNGNFITQWGSDAPQILYSPNEVAVYENRVYVTEARNRSVVVYSYDIPTFDSFYPQGFVNSDYQRPTLTYKRVAADDGYAMLDVELDPGKNKNYAVKNISKRGDGTNPFIWLDDQYVRVWFDNEQDSDPNNDLVSVYFKDLGGSELTEGMHAYKVTGKAGGTYTSQTQDFYLDLTAPELQGLAVDGPVGYVEEGKTYSLNSSQTTPTIWGTIIDPYKGSERHNDNGTKDTFEPVSSGPKEIIITTEKKTGNEFVFYSTTTKPIEVVNDVNKVDKSSLFYIPLAKPLENGQYKITVKASDQVLNTRETQFYLNLNHQNYVVQKNDSLVNPTQKPEAKDTTTSLITPQPSATPKTNQPEPGELPDNTQEEIKETVQRPGFFGRIINGVKQFIYSLKK